LFNPGNIIEISRPEDIRVAEAATLHLVFWHDFQESIDDILRVKRDADALVVYSPQGQGFISQEQMNKLDGHRHTTVANLRGRLLNDIVSTMITTAYEKY